jgi:pyruvate/2-oxoglutarate dehydrogenase complex dihydrolipoamide dehydrogenase (E3) component
LLPGVPIPFEKGRIVCATEMGSLNDLPNSLAIIGGGVIATEYATVFAEVL